MTNGTWPIVLNQSSYKDYSNCPRLFAWKRLEGLSALERASALEIGTAIHLALALYHSGGHAESVKCPNCNRFLTTEPDDCELDHRALLAEWYSKITPGGPKLVDDVVGAATDKLRIAAGPTARFADKDLSEATDIVQRVLSAYFEHWSKEGEIWQPLNQEIQFFVEVGEETNVFLRGRADNLSTAKGGLYLVDYKTSARMDPRDLLKYELDLQLSAYIYGLSKQLSLESIARGGQPIWIRGAIIDVLVKTQVPQFAREFYTRSVDELEEFEAEFAEGGAEIRTKIDRVKAGEDWKTVFRKNTDSCFKWGRACGFRDLCLKDTPARRALYDKRKPDYVDTAQTAALEAFAEGRDVAEASGVSNDSFK